MLLLSASAGADQRVIIDPGRKPAAFNSEVRVNVSLNFFVPVPLDNTDALAKAQERARRMLYESGSKECELLQATIAGECRLEGISVNVRMNRSYGQQGPGLNASGNFNYRITLK
jgi:hypothetical protein